MKAADVVSVNKPKEKNEITCTNKPAHDQAKNDIAGEGIPLTTPYTKVSVDLVETGNVLKLKDSGKQSSSDCCTCANTCFKQAF